MDKTYDSQGRVSGAMCHTKKANGSWDRWGLDVNTNPAYNPSVELPESYKSFNEIAQKIISNASSSDQGVSLMAEAYLDNVANSINETDESKRFVKPSDLNGMFELNKTVK